MIIRTLAAAVALTATGLHPAAAAPAAIEPCSAVSVGPAQVVVDNATRLGLGLKGWPDTAFGVLPEGGGQYRFLSVSALVPSGNTNQSISTTRGTLDNPVAGGAKHGQVQNIPAGYQYAGGGPVFRDPGSGLVLQMLHLERSLDGPNHQFYSDLHLGLHDPATGHTRRLGEIIAPDMEFATAHQHKLTADIGTSSFVLRDGFLYAYFPDYSFDNGKWVNTPLSVARAPLAEVIAAAKQGKASEWKKYHQGAWNSPGRNGPSSAVREQGVGAWHPSVVKTTRGGTIMVAGNSITEFVLATSPDGITGWSGPTTLFRDPERGNAYPTIVGTGADPSIVDNEFYLYYLQWAKAGDWANAVAMRRHVTCVAGRTLPRTTLTGYVNGAQHRTSTVLDRTPGFAPEPGRLWQLDTAAAPGTVPLYGCRNGADHYLSLAAGCDSPQHAALQSEGRIYTAPPATPSTPLYRCKSGGDHFTSTAADCEGRGTQDQVLGHALTTTQRAFSRFYDGREHWDTSGPVTAKYTLEHRWFLETAAKPGTVALYGCAYTSVKGRNHFVSTQSGCENQTALRTEGWAYLEQPSAPSIPLHRCYWPEQDDHFLSPHENCEGVPGGRNEGRLGYALT
ncbi:MULTISPECIES: hypothetical protein [unclassified Crossiella]|uniref:hypothetical protein n=1 Tax=unclassified Crossiella TaxID=2620835 RepID=UPI001FFE6266|nr:MULTISPECIES: hypothetical protein [unclassified Crossiella]MCK2238477.1 hypothetical protein [Crossiella sp. S99.2]MCK2251953.1 hypothetical protein [Crossiella sp. S99.1]